MLDLKKGDEVEFEYDGGKRGMGIFKFIDELDFAYLLGQDSDYRVKREQIKKVLGNVFNDV